MDLIYNERIKMDGITNHSEDKTGQPIVLEYESYEYNYGNETEMFPDMSCDARTLRVYSFIILIPAILGIIGNSVSAWIINRQPDGAASVMALLLKVLAFVDNSYVILYVLTMHLTYVFYYSNMVEPSSLAVQIFTIISEPVLFFSQMSTVYVTVIIALMRYIAICKPFKATTLCTKSNAWWAILAVALLSSIIHIPMFFLYSLQKDDDGIWYAAATRLSTRTSYTFGYRIVFMDILMRGLVPLTALIFFNGRLLLSIYKQPKLPCMSRPHEGLTAAQQKEATNVTIVIMAIIAVFILSYIPQTVNIIIHETYPERFQMGCGSPEYYVNYVFDALMVLNSCVNFVIYYLLRANFRKRLKLSIFANCITETAL